jgi:hypothetical protein
MVNKDSISVEREKLRLEADLQQFLYTVKGTMVLTPEEKKGAKTKSDSLKFDDPSVQKRLQPVLEIAIQSNFWKAKTDLKATWITGSVMRLAEGIFKYTRVKGGVTGGIRGILKALNWGKSQAYRAKELSEVFGDDLVKMPVGITAAKLAELLERRKRDKKHGKVFDPIAWLDEHKEALRDAKSADAVKELLGTVKEKTTPKPKSVETEENPDQRVEVITVLNIVAKIKPCEQAGLNDVVLKSVSDTQVEGLKNWLKAQRMLGEEGESVRRPDTFGADPDRQSPTENEVPDSFKHLLDRVCAKTGRKWTGESPSSDIWNLFGWTDQLIDTAIDRWDELELEEKCFASVGIGQFPMIG